MSNDHFKDIRLNTDEVLLNMLVGKRQMPYVGDRLFKTVPVALRNGKLAISNTEDYVYISGKQDPNAPAKEIGVELTPFTYALDDYSYSYKVSDELIEEEALFHKMMGQTEAQALFFQVSQRGMAKMRSKAAMEREYLQSALSTNPASYPAENVYTVVNKWDNPATNMQHEFEKAITQVMGICGIAPNIVLLSYDLFNALKSNAQILDMIKYSMKGIVTKELLAEIIGVDEIIVGAASYRTDEVAAKQFFWSDCAIFWYEPPSVGSEEPYFGLRMQKKDRPMIQTWKDQPDMNFWRLKDSYVNALLSSPGGVLVDVPLT